MENISSKEEVPPEGGESTVVVVVKPKTKKATSGGPRCCVLECGRKMKKGEITLHNMRESWQRTLLGKTNEYYSMKVCNTHFAETDMDEYRGGKRPRTGCVPTLNLPDTVLDATVADNSTSHTTNTGDVILPPPNATEMPVKDITNRITNRVGKEKKHKKLKLTLAPPSISQTTTSQLTAAIKPSQTDIMSTAKRLLHGQGRSQGDTESIDKTLGIMLVAGGRVLTTYKGFKCLRDVAAAYLDNTNRGGWSLSCSRSGVDLVFNRLVYFPDILTPSVQSVNVVRSDSSSVDGGRFNLAYRTPLPTRYKSRDKTINSKTLIVHMRYKVQFTSWAPDNGTNKPDSSSVLDILDWQWREINAISSTAPSLNEKVTSWQKSAHKPIQENDTKAEKAGTPQGVSERCATPSSAKRLIFGGDDA